MIAWVVGISASVLIGAAIGVTLMCVVIVGSDRRRPKTCRNVPIDGVNGVFACSVCGSCLDIVDMKQTDVEVSYEPNYCPDCGARVVHEQASA